MFLGDRSGMEWITPPRLSGISRISQLGFSLNPQFGLDAKALTAKYAKYANKTKRECFSATDQDGMDYSPRLSRISRISRSGFSLDPQFGLDAKALTAKQAK